MGLQVNGETQRQSECPQPWVPLRLFPQDTRSQSTLTPAYEKLSWVPEAGPGSLHGIRIPLPHLLKDQTPSL